MKLHEADVDPEQQEGIDRLVTRKRYYIGDEMGFGKTFMGLAARERIKSGIKTTLVAVGVSGALDVWEKELNKWEVDCNPVFVLGSPSKREELWASKGDIFICMLHSLVIDQKNGIIPNNWDLIIIDEFDIARNRRTKIFKALKKLYSEYLFLFSGTPARKGPQDIWTALHLINPKLFRSYWKWVNTFCYVIDGPFGKSIEGVRNKDALKKLLPPYFMRRRLKNAPPLTRQRYHIEMTEEQSTIYDTLVEDLMVEIGDSLLITPSILGLQVRLRQLFICPKILDESLGYGASIEEMQDIIRRYDRDQQHLVIFTPYTKAFPFIVDAVKEVFEGPVNTLSGGISKKIQSERIKQFRDEKGIMVVSVKYAKSFELDTANKGFFIGAEFDPDENYQAEGRLRRRTTKHPINIHYFVHGTELEDRQFEILNTKQRNVKILYSGAQELKQLLTLKN